MYCDKCGSPVPDGQETCNKCGQKVQTGGAIAALRSAKGNESAAPANGNTLMLVTSIVLFVFALALIIVGFVAAGMIADGGMDISRIKSVGGKTLEEAYYRNYGEVLMGIAWLARIISVGFALVLGYLGMKSFSKAR